MGLFYRKSTMDLVREYNTKKIKEEERVRKIVLKELENICPFAKPCHRLLRCDGGCFQKY